MLIELTELNEGLRRRRDGMLCTFLWAEIEVVMAWGLSIAVFAREITFRLPVYISDIFCVLNSGLCSFEYVLHRIFW